MVKCCDGSIYTGLTNNLDRRVQEHNFGFNKASYTFSRRPVKLIFYQEFIQFEQAEIFEKKIKKWSRGKKLALAGENYILLKNLSECKNESNFRHFNNINHETYLTDNEN